MIKTTLLFISIAAMGTAGCSGSSSSTDDRSGGESENIESLFADLVDDERETVMIESGEISASEFDIMPAAFDTIIVRAAPGSSEAGRAVDALLKGSFPDACTQLHELSQRSSEAGAVVSLTMRRPRSAICAQVVRPYRYFFELDGTYAIGDHTLVVNDRPYAFSIE